VCILDGRRYSFTFRHCKPVIIQDSCSWPYDKTYDTQSFVGHGNYDDPRLKMSFLALCWCGFVTGKVHSQLITRWRRLSAFRFPENRASPHSKFICWLFSLFHHSLLDSARYLLSSTAEEMIWSSGTQFTKYLTTVLRLSYNNSKVTIDSQGCLIYKTFYEERKALIRHDLLAKS